MFWVFKTTKTSLSKIQSEDRIIVKSIKGGKVVDEVFKAQMVYIYN
jgi:hypothetical protein